MRTQEEIVEKIKDDTGSFGFASEAIADFLPKEMLTEFFNVPDNWVPLELSRESVLNQMRAYMADYGWPKALGHRGISAGRTIEKMNAWTWLLGDEEFPTEPYSQYGVPILVKVCERYGFPIPEDPAVARMANGEPCQQDCEEGCS